MRRRRWAAGARRPCGFGSISRARPTLRASNSSPLLPRSASSGTYAECSRWRRSRRRRHQPKRRRPPPRPRRTPIDCQASSRGPASSSRSGRPFAPVLCPPKLLPIRPYHVQRGQAQDSDDDDEAPPPKEGEEKKNESTTDVYDKRYLAEKKLIGDWGREPVVDEGYDPSKHLGCVQKPAAEPAAAKLARRASSFVCKGAFFMAGDSRHHPLASRKTLASRQAESSGVSASHCSSWRHLREF